MCDNAAIVGRLPVAREVHASCTEVLNDLTGAGQTSGDGATSEASGGRELAGELATELTAELTAELARERSTTVGGGTGARQEGGTGEGGGGGTTESVAGGHEVRATIAVDVRDGGAARVGAGTRVGARVGARIGAAGVATERGGTISGGTETSRVAAREASTRQKRSTRQSGGRGTEGVAVGGEVRDTVTVDIRDSGAATDRDERRDDSSATRHAHHRVRGRDGLNGRHNGSGEGSADRNGDSVAVDTTVPAERIIGDVTAHSTITRIVVAHCE